VSYTIEYIEKECGLVIKWNGAVTGDEIVESYKDRFSDLERVKKLKYIVVDYSGVTDMHASENEILTISRISSDVAANYNSTLYAAAIMPSDISYGLARMAQAYTDDDRTGWHTFVSRSREDVNEWLRLHLGNLKFRNC